jgi:hypothetical protein
MLPSTFAQIKTLAEMCVTSHNELIDYAEEMKQRTHSTTPLLKPLKEVQEPRQEEPGTSLCVWAKIQAANRFCSAPCSTTSPSGVWNSSSTSAMLPSCAPKVQLLPSKRPELQPELQMVPPHSQAPLNRVLPLALMRQAKPQHQLRCLRALLTRPL